jgi:hypothetical protein
MLERVRLYDLDCSISHACGSSKAVSDLVEELLGSGVLALSQPPMRFMMEYYV